MKTIGFCITGSFCTFEIVLKEMEKLVKDYNIIPIFSFNTALLDTRFFKAKDFRAKVKEITGKEPVDTLVTAEPLGPSGLIDIMVVAPCTGNTLAKLANAVTDTPVLMAVKSHLRNNKPIVIALSTNDALGLNMVNLGKLMHSKNIFFVPLGQDNAEKKPNSIIADYGKIQETIENAIVGKQIQPLLIVYNAH